MLIMTQLTPEQRRFIGLMIKQGIAKKVIASTLSCSRVTVWYWSIQDLRTRFNIERNPHGKITIEVEATILCMRQTFRWGTARIQQGLDNLPDFMKTELKIILQHEPVQNFDLSRQSIHQILKKWGINRNGKKRKTWKFFRAKYANELWQVDLKEFKFEGKKYYIFVCIDDYSRYILLLKLFDKCPTTKDLTSALQKLNIKPNKILADNGSQFKEQWKNWCIENGSEPIFAHPYYPQDKGKVERAIRNLSEEYVYLIAEFPHWFDERHMEEWRCWFNKKRFHRGVKDYPANLYFI
jgi:hypothetical protein